MGVKQAPDLKKGTGDPVTGKLSEEELQRIREADERESELKLSLDRQLSLAHSAGVAYQEQRMKALAENQAVSEFNSKQARRRKTLLIVAGVITVAGVVLWAVERFLMGGW